MSTLCEMKITSLDDAHHVSGQSHDGKTPLVFTLPPRNCCNLICDFGCIQRVPNGFFPIVTTCGAIKHEDPEKPWEGGQCFCLWTRVQKLVTKQLNVYELPVKNVKTSDNVTVFIKALTVFKIVNGEEFLFGLGPEKLDLLLKAHLEEAIRRMAVETGVRNLYDLRGRDMGLLREEINKTFQEEGAGVTLVNITLVDVSMPPDLVEKMMNTTGFLSQTFHLEAEQMLKEQGLENDMEIARTVEEANVAKMQVDEQGANELAKLDIEITGIKSRSSKECAAIRAEAEEKVQELVNDAELEVVDLNNARDSVMREVQGLLAKERNEIKAEAWMYSRARELEKVIKSAENVAKGKKVIAESEAQGAEVLAARRAHEQQMERLLVFDALARNDKLRIAGSAEVQAGSNMAFSSDEFDGVVQAGVNWMKSSFNAPGASGAPRQQAMNQRGR